MHLIIAVLFALPVRSKVENNWNLTYRGITPKSGSDAYGYFYLSNQDGDPVSFEWIEISSSGTNFNLADDDSALVNLPFTFRLYNDTTSTIYVQSNGGITFRNIKLSYSNHALPDTNGTMIAIYWSDQNPSSHGGVYYQAFGDTMAVIEWYEVPEYSSTSYNTYEVVLYSDGRIKFQYYDINEYSDETIGIQSKDAFASGNGWYIQYVYDNTPQQHVPQDSTVIIFYPPTPQEHDIGILALTTPPFSYVNDSVTITVTIKNYGLNAETFNVMFILDTNSTTVFDTIVENVYLDTAQITDVSIRYQTNIATQYNVTAFIELPTDSNYINDTSYTTLKAIDFMPLPFITDFETDSGYFFHDGTNDPWEWGVASYVHSGTHAWATILTDNYPPNSNASLYSYAIDLTSFSMYDSTYLTFWYFDSLETNYDFVYLMITQDRGATWDTIRTYNGYSNSWTQEYIDLRPYNGEKIQIAFLFTSDGSIQKAGFFLDDLKVGIPLDNDVGIQSINITPSITRPDDTVNIEIIIHNFGLLGQSNFSTKYFVLKSNLDTIFEDSLLIQSLQPSEDSLITFNFIPHDTGTFSIIAYTLLSTDEYRGNDTMISQFISGKPDFTLEKYTIGGDGIVDPGELNIPIIMYVVNNGARADTVNFQLSTTYSNITIHEPNHDIGQVFYNDTIVDTFFIDVSSAANNGDLADFTLTITADNNYQSVSNFQIIIGGKFWTVMVFINGDNNLTSYGVRDIDEMETVGSNDYLNILVQIDGYTSYTDSTGTHVDANRYYILHNPTPNDMIDAYPIMNLGEVNMGDTNSVFDFFKWGVDNYPARHYLFIIWDHGSGWVKSSPIQKGISHDDTDNDYLSFANGEVRALIKKMHDYVGKNIDILGYDVCLTQMVENINEIYGYVDHIVASEKSEPGDGWDYHFLEAIATNPDITPHELASEIVNYYSQYYSNQSNLTLSAIQLNRNIQKIFGLINNLARHLIKAGGINRSDLQNIINNLNGEIELSSPYEYFVDLKHLASEIRNAAINDTITSICDSIIDLFDNNTFFDNSWVSSDISSSISGISITLPPSGESLSGWEGPYSGLLISSQTLWYRFLEGATALPDTPHTTLNRAFFMIQDTETDTLPGNSQGTLHIILSNYTNEPDTNITLHISAPSYLTFEDTTVNIPEIPADSSTQIELPFTIPPEVISESNCITIILNGANYSDNYNIPYIITSTTLAEEHNQYALSNKFYTQTLLKSGSIFPVQFNNGASGNVNISLFDIQGRKIKTLYEDILHKGSYTLKLKLPNTLSPGIYFLILDTSSSINKARLLIIK